MVIREKVKLIEDSCKLVFANISVFGSIEILEMRFHQDSFVLNFSSVVVNNLIELSLFCLTQFLFNYKKIYICYLVLSSGRQSGFPINLINLMERVFVNIFLSEYFVHIFNELRVLD